MHTPQIIDTFIADPETGGRFAEEAPYPNSFIAMAYRRALALEQLGRNDKALTAYQELSESDTIWGRIAGLHLEEN